MHREAEAENASTLMSVTSEVSDVAEVTDACTDVRSAEFETGTMDGAAPGIIPRAFHLDAALGVERKKNM